MKALQIISGRMYGGGQRVAVSLLESLAGRNEVESGLVLLGCHDSELAKYATAVTPFDGRYNNPMSLFKSAAALRRLLKASGADIVHSHGWDADIITSLAVRGLPAAHLIHLHVTADWLESDKMQHRIRRFLTGRMFGRVATRIAAVSEAVRGHWARTLPWEATGIRTILNGIDVRRFSAIAHPANNGAACTLGAAARLAPMKGLENLLKAMSDLGTTEPRIKLAIAGEGPLLGRLIELSRSLQIEDRVRFLGRVNDMPAFYAGLDVLVLPSISTEGLPLTVLEGMAAGLPVIATDVGGTAEALRDGRDGLIVPPGDPRALAGAIGRIAKDPELRRQMGSAGRIRAGRHFSLERFSSELLSLYREMALGSGTP